MLVGYLVSLFTQTLHMSSSNISYSVLGALLRLSKVLEAILLPGAIFTLCYNKVYSTFVMKGTCSF